VIKVDAYADILLVDGNPLKDIKLLADPKKNLNVIMKDGKFYKNTLANNGMLNKQLQRTAQSCCRLLGPPFLLKL